MPSSLRHSFFRHVAQTAPEPDGFEVSRGEGVYLYDLEGKPFLDCISGSAVSSLGHRHPKISAAIKNQLDVHLHTSVYGEHVQKPQVVLAEKLAELLPDPLDCTYFTSSGAEAVEGALKLARKYTSRYELIACRQAYHGSTAGAESLRSDLEHINAVRPLVPGIKHIRFSAEEDLMHITEKTAGVIIEPVQGEAGAIVPARGYFKALRDRCTQTGTMLIMDEIQTGLGRTGKLWAFEHEGIVPDILLLAKALGGGLPLGAFISSQEKMHVLSHNPILGHLTTFGGHPLSCAASLAAIDLILSDHLVDNAARQGQRIKEKMNGHPAIREVRGRGLMMAIDLQIPEQLHKAVADCRSQGLLVDWFLFNDRSLRLAPPIIITDKETDTLCEKLWKALEMYPGSGSVQP